MYDFEGDHGPGSTQHGGPSPLLTALELPRFLAEYASSRAWDLVTGTSEVGAGRPVLVIPGFSATDGATSRLRSHLRRHGFHVHGWGQGRNIGLTDRLVDGLDERFASLRDRHGDPISIVGWSFGGLLARSLAHRYPDDVRQIVCLASPWRADGERTRATAMFERSRARYGIADRARDLVDQARRPVPVPTTAVWSRSDGVVPWRGCRVDETDHATVAENVEVVSSHVGMASSPLVLSVVLDRLQQDPADWTPASRRGGFGRAVAPAARRGVRT